MFQNEGKIWYLDTWQSLRQLLCPAGQLLDFSLEHQLRGVLQRLLELEATNLELTCTHQSVALEGLNLSRYAC